MTRFRWMFAGFALFVVAVIVSADTGWADWLLEAVHVIPLGDKLCHCIFMGTLCWLANRSFRSEPVTAAIPWLTWPTVIISTLVVAEEFSQIWIPGRTFSLADLAADGLGIAVAVWLTCPRPLSVA
ncbi:MAG: trypsin [Planctomycetaceae bacterium]|nr:MAG: trypsin [Planctomycetaceae bacterium]